MSLQSRLQQHFAGKDASWSADAATWTESGQARVLYWSDGALTASAVVDAHTRALKTSARPTLAYSGAITEVARAAAARFGVTLLNAAALPEPAPAREPDAGLAVTIRDAPPHVEPVPIAPALVAQMIEPLLPAHVEPEALPAPAAVSSPLPDIDPRFPWPVAEPALSIRVAAEELAAMPWNAPHVLLNAPPEHDDHHELVVTERRPAGLARPTQLPNWGLPWPRPVTPADGLAIADPKLWGARERVHAVREDLDRAGVGSFGAVKPDGSTWLKKLQTDLP